MRARARCPPETGQHRADVLIGDDTAELPVDELQPLLREKPLSEALPMLQDALLERAEKLASSGYSWVQLVSSEARLNGALIYMGAEPIAMQSASQ